MMVNKKRFDPERDLRAWADALNAVADLQVAIVAQARDMTMLDREGIERLEPFRAIVLGTLRTFPERAKGVDMFESARGLQHTATEARALLQKQVAERK